MTVTAAANLRITSADSPRQDLQVYGTAEDWERRAEAPLTVTLTPLFPSEPPGTVNPPDDPGVPPSDKSYGSPTFNPASVPRISPYPARARNLQPHKFTLTIGGTDFSDCLVGFQFDQSFDGPNVARLELVQVPGFPSLNPITNPTQWARGTRVSLLQELENFDKREIFSGEHYLIDAPAYEEFTGAGQRSLVYVGDIRRLLDGEQIGLSEPYCGPQPRTVGKAANLFLELRTGGKSWSLPGKAKLVEEIDDPRQQSPDSYLRDLMAADGRRLYTNRLGALVAPNRTGLSLSTTIALTRDDLLEPPILTGNSKTLPYSKARVRSIADIESPPVRAEIRFRRVPEGYNPNDRRPRELNGVGWHEDIYQVFTGDRLKYEEIKLSGWRPTLAEFDETSNPGSTDSATCGGRTALSDYWNTPGNEGDSVFQNNYQISTYRADTVKHQSGKYLIQREDFIRKGNEILRRESDGKLVVYPSLGGSTTLETDVTIYRNTPLPSDKVCERDYEHVITYRTTRRDNTTEPTVGRKLVFGQDIYSYQNRTSRVLAGNASGDGLTWYKETRETADVQGQTIWGPWVISTEEPEQSPWIFYKSERLELEATVNIPAIAAETGQTLSTDVQGAPYVYTDEGLRRWGEGYLRDEAGKYGAIAIELPWPAALSIGQAVTYDWGDGNPLPYVVWSLSDQLQTTEKGPELRYGCVLRREYRNG